MKSNLNDDNFARHIKAIKGLKLAHKPVPSPDSLIRQQSVGLADLQHWASSTINRSRSWGFADTPFNVRREKQANGTWKLTVENPKTRQIILQAEGLGDKVFAHEDNLARMAEALIENDLKITTPGR